MKHTPGPWKVVAGNIRASNGTYVAYEINTANAKLIAASPMMYAELERIAQVPLPGEEGYRTPDKHDAHGFIRIARDAIAKATA